ncbi:RNA-binding S4 domain-containing protein [Deinococcus sp. YIM 134068]|uniref:RNA-binding S4 domain-containing protein n=1 Tax=Deinococcus lichenicola TaxID=3118910 RepID=UPI002F959A2A
MTYDDARPEREERDTIDLQDFLKLRGMVETGGEAKFRVQGGEVRLNGVIETRRRKKLRRGDIVEYAGERVRVDW